MKIDVIECVCPCCIRMLLIWLSTITSTIQTTFLTSMMSCLTKVRTKYIFETHVRNFHIRRRRTCLCSHWCSQSCCSQVLRPKSRSRTLLSLKCLKNRFSLKPYFAYGSYPAKIFSISFVSRHFTYSKVARFFFRLLLCPHIARRTSRTHVFCKL